MTFIRLSDVDRDRHLLVNLDHIVEVGATQGPRGLQQRACKLSISLSDGRALSCFPIDANGGFDSQTKDESTVIHNFQQAARRLCRHPELEQGSELNIEPGPARPPSGSRHA